MQSVKSQHDSKVDICQTLNHMHRLEVNAHSCIECEGVCRAQGRAAEKRMFRTPFPRYACTALHEVVFCTTRTSPSNDLQLGLPCLALLLCMPPLTQGGTVMQAQAWLWEGSSALSERLDVLHAALRELVVRRYRERDMTAIEAGRLGDVDFLPADEEPGYREQWQQNRPVPRPKHLPDLSQCTARQFADHGGRCALTPLHNSAGKLHLLLQWISQKAASLRRPPRAYIWQKLS